MRSAAVYFVGIVAWGACAPAAPVADKGVPRTLIDRTLQERQVQLTGLEPGTVSYTDSGGLVRTEPSDELLAILPGSDDGTAAGAALRPPSVVELVDGQRFAGTLGAIRGEPGDSIAWDHPVLGTLEIKLDHIRRFQFRSGARAEAGTPSAPGDSDTAVLTNGDRVVGLVEGIGAAGGKPVLRLAGGPQSRDIPLERVQEVLLMSNPAASAPAGSVMAWLRDGSIVACRALHTNRTGEVSLDLAMQEPRKGAGEPGTLAAPSVVSLTDVLGADLHPGTMVPLASLNPVEQTAASSRRWTRPVAVVSPDALLRLSDVEVPGPMSAEWEIPAGALRFSAEAELPRAMWNWGDCTVAITVRAEGRDKELFRQRLTAEQPRATINAPLEKLGAGARLRVTVEAGSAGPVQDRVVLKRPVLLVGTAKPASP